MSRVSAGLALFRDPVRGPAEPGAPGAPSGDRVQHGHHRGRRARREVRVLVDERTRDVTGCATMWSTPGPGSEPGRPRPARARHAAAIASRLTRGGEAIVGCGAERLARSCGPPSVATGKQHLDSNGLLPRRGAPGRQAPSTIPAALRLNRPVDCRPVVHRALPESTQEASVPEGHVITVTGPRAAVDARRRRRARPPPARLAGHAGPTRSRTWSARSTRCARAARPASARSSR